MALELFLLTSWKIKSIARTRMEGSGSWVSFRGGRQAGSIFRHVFLQKYAAMGPSVQKGFQSVTRGKLVPSATNKKRAERKKLNGPKILREIRLLSTPRNNATKMVHKRVVRVITSGASHPTPSKKNNNETGEGTP